MDYMGLLGLLGMGGGGATPLAQAAMIDNPAMTDTLMGMANTKPGMNGINISQGANDAPSMGQKAAAARSQPNPMAQLMLMQGLAGMGRQNAPMPNPAPMPIARGGGGAVQGLTIPSMSEIAQRAMGAVPQLGFDRLNLGGF